VRDLLRKWGFEARRGIQAAGEADISHDIPGYHIEAKNDENISIWAMLRQAEHDAQQRDGGGSNQEPLLFFKRNGTKLYAAVDAERMMKLLRLESTYDEFKEINDVQP
jgi:hypothetical protein